MRRCFIVHLRRGILAESERWSRITGSLLHIPFQLEYLRLEHQVNFFMGCDCHIELLFKRYKSLLDLDRLRARAGSLLGQVWLHGKMLYACLIEQRAQRRCGPDWTRLDSERRGSWWRVWRLVRDELTPLITLSQWWDLRALPAAFTALAARPL